MEPNANNITINPDGMPKASLSELWLRRIARVLLPIISLTISLQPVAMASPSPSLLAQEPRFLDVSVESNVMFIMDDSLSMDDVRLPVPAALNPNEATGGNVTTRNGLSVERVNEWIFRSSTLNPLYYNPAITYTPWNDNGRAGTAGRFTNSSTAMNQQANGFREGLVRHDLRYAGPNYTSSGFNGADRLTTTGANPPAVPGYLSTARPLNGGFEGTVDAGRNQDIYSSPFVFVTTLTQICLTGAVSQITTAQPTSGRTDSTQPSTARTSTAQPTSSRTNSAQPSTARVITVQLSTARLAAAQPFTPRTDSIQPSTARTSSTQPSTARATTAQPSTARTTVAATSTARPTEYRYQTGACGSGWSAWAVAASPPGQLCSDPNSEGGVRAALVESRLQDCAITVPGSTTSGNNCLSCAAGSTLSGAQCISNCPAGTVGSNATTCYSACPAGSTQTTLGSCRADCPAGSPGSTATLCYQVCPAGTTQTALGTCTTTCPAGTVGSTATLCYSACPAGTSQVVLGTCRTTCPAGTVGSTATACYSACAAGYTQNPLGTCLQDCPVGTVGSTATLCYSACPAGTTQTALGTCASNCPAGTVGSTATICYQACPAGTVQTALGNCRTSCPAGTLSSNATTCFLPCASGTLSGGLCLDACPVGTVGSTSTACYTACPAGTSQASLGVCRTDCPAGTLSSNATTCFLPCSTGTLSGGTCNSCPAGTSPFGTNQCCQTAGTTGPGCPYLDATRCTTSNTYYPASDTEPAPARFFVFVPVDNSRAPTTGELSDPANYERREINRDAPRYQATFDKPFKNNDPTQGRADRPDCGAGTTCTWAQEAQNFANWYTYYRTRLFSAIAVSAQSLSALTRVPSRLDSLRLGYGSINYFPNGFNPYPNVNPFSNTPFASSFTLDGQPSDGHIVRGVRPFTEVSPPPAPGSNDRRQETFDWLFSLRGIASTPNREALDAVGRYFTRSDSQGPWIQPANTTSWSSAEFPSDHVPCRRNYAIMITDGEWTNSPETFGSGQQQPVLGGSQRLGNAPAALASQGGSPLNALTTNGPTHTRTGAGSPPTYQYVPGNEPQFSGGAGAVTNTLSDVAFYYWSRDLRPDMENNIRPITSSTDTAFWQHLTPFIVGYGISASRDTAATRSAIAAGTAVTWDTVTVESRPTENPRTIVTDQDRALSPPAAATPATLLTCNYDPITNPSGCGRVNDTFRAAMAARADFLAATDVAGLATGIASAFARIGEVEGAATAFTGRSASVEAGDRLYSASFITNRWTGRVEAYDALALNSAFQSGSAPPSSIFTSNFPTSGARNIVTSTAVGGSGTSFAWASLTAAQQTALGSAAVVAWLRGDAAGEARNGGVFRNRDPGEIMGDIVNSNPLYSKASDALYNAFRRPAAAATGSAPPNDSAAVTYPAFLAQNRSSRPAAIYVGSNSGMLHAFNASDLSERFAYVPRAVYSTLPFLAAPGYVHRYYVDGPVVEGDVYIGGAWRTVVVGTTGAGPKGIFALDVTQRSGATPQDFSSGDVLWDIAGTDTSLSNIADLGNITQPGVIGSGKDGEWYYFTGNGWESGNDKARLLAIRIRDGAILSIATDNFGGPNPASGSLNLQPNGLGGISPVYDGNRNVVAIYAGDRLGRLWKFDLSSTSTASWTVATGAPLFTAEDNSANRQPISAAPRVMAHPLGGRLIAFGTGRLTEGADIGNTAVQSIYAVWEKNPNAPVAVARASLRQFTFTETGTAAARDRLRSLNGVASLNWGTDNGWRVDLMVGTNAVGERVFVTPIEQAGFLNFTSFEPIAGGDRCTGGGASFFYRFDIAGNFTRSGIRAPGGGVRPPDVVGSEFLGSVGGLRIFGRASDTTASSLSVLDKGSLRDMLANPKKSAATDACASGGPGGNSVPNVPTGGALAPCPNQAQRVWRELPRGRR